ncbi:hypothetical protein L2U69_15595 [Zavarzinia compransoris]|uniref:cell division protein FtsL n=1 Tax=Zavarzinia marina TaxID=2911065 RepID=UPI001F2160AC|nr:hypothetical protein [Zavarzinia marina]MCF4167077.1 hypothetical protein [Zavarzinia marina]
MNRFLTLATVALAIGAPTVLYQVKYEVGQLEQEARALHRDVAREHQAIQVLQAEWAYLNQPARIQDLAERYLDLQPLKPTQITTLDRLPMRPIVPEGEGVPDASPDASTSPVPLLAATPGLPVVPTLKPAWASLAPAPATPRPTGPRAAVVTPVPAKPAAPKPAPAAPTRSAAAPRPAPTPVAATVPSASDDVLDGVARIFAAGEASYPGEGR